jgi:hypothetical protein
LPKQTLAIARSGGADVLVPVKENQPDLPAMCQMSAQYQSPSQQHVDRDKGHGRIETRMIDTFLSRPVSGCRKARNRWLKPW